GRPTPILRGAGDAGRAAAAEDGADVVPVLDPAGEAARAVDGPDVRALSTRAICLRRERGRRLLPVAAGPSPRRARMHLGRRVQEKLEWVAGECGAKTWAQVPTRTLATVRYGMQRMEVCRLDMRES